MFFWAVLEFFDAELLKLLVYFFKADRAPFFAALLGVVIRSSRDELLSLSVV